MSIILSPNKSSKFIRNKPLAHCRNNKVKLQRSIQCEKCKYQDKRFTKNFNTVNSLYQHLILQHNGNDKYEFPTKEDCLKKLQEISNSMKELENKN